MNGSAFIFILLISVPFTSIHGAEGGPYKTLATPLRERLLKPRKNLDDITIPPLSIEKTSKEVEDALAALSSSQQVLKGLDGAAHEAYQRTHRSASTKISSQVSGRARRSASRAGVAADALLSAELCELLEDRHLLAEEMEGGDEGIGLKNGTLLGRSVVGEPFDVRVNKHTNVTCLVLFESEYSGGSGLDHGGIESLGNENEMPRAAPKATGRVLIVLADSARAELSATLNVLDRKPLQIELSAGLVANEMASVQPQLYQAAGRLMDSLSPWLMHSSPYNSTDTAVHFVGRSLAGAVGALAAAILDGSLPMPEFKKRRSTMSHHTNTTIQGLGQGRSSAVVLGAPPCLSSNVKVAFVKSVVFGDDIVCRTTYDSISRLLDRLRGILKGGFLAKRVGWVTDTVSLTMTSLRNHAHGSEGEEAKLSIPGQGFLVRPRRLAGLSSIHEIQGQKGGREALREQLLWQLEDVLLSDSLWKHHQLEVYIHGLDRVQLRGFDQDSEG